MPLYYNPQTGKQTNLLENSSLVTSGKYIPATGNTPTASNLQGATEARNQGALTPGEYQNFLSTGSPTTTPELTPGVTETAMAEEFGLGETGTQTTQDIIDQIFETSMGGLTGEIQDFKTSQEDYIAGEEVASNDYITGEQTASQTYLDALSGQYSAASQSIADTYDAEITRMSYEIEEGLQTLDTQWAFTGGGRGTAAYEARAMLQAQGNSLLSALSNAKAAEVAANEVALAGASAEEITRMNTLAADARAEVQTLKNTLSQTMIELQGGVQQLGVSAQEQFLPTILQTAGISTQTDEELLNALGYGTNPTTGAIEPLAGLTETELGVGQIGDVFAKNLAELELGNTKDMQDINTALTLAELFGFDVAGTLGTEGAQTLDAMALYQALSEAQASGAGGGAASDENARSTILSYFKFAEQSQTAYDIKTISDELVYNLQYDPALIWDVYNNDFLQPAVETPASEGGGLMDAIKSFFSGSSGGSTPPLTGPGSSSGAASINPLI